MNCVKLEYLKFRYLLVSRVFLESIDVSQHDFLTYLVTSDTVGTGIIRESRHWKLLRMRTISVKKWTNLPRNGDSLKHQLWKTVVYLQGDHDQDQYLTLIKRGQSPLNVASKLTANNKCISQASVRRYMPKRLGGNVYERLDCLFSLRSNNNNKSRGGTFVWRWVHPKWWLLCVMTTPSVSCLLSRLPLCSHPSILIRRV